MDLVRQAIADLPNVEVEPYSGLTVDFVKKVGADTIVRGLRVVGDFEREFAMALMNKELSPDCEIVWEYISPFYGPFVVYGQANLIYRAYRYGHEYEGLIGKNLDPDKFKWLNGIYGPDAT